ncbi:uncharacterized protein METZ01_LOCUS366404, partial [marine metagenome]
IREAQASPQQAQRADSRSRRRQPREHAADFRFGPHRSYHADHHQGASRGEGGPGRRVGWPGPRGGGGRRLVPL